MTSGQVGKDGKPFRAVQSPGDMTPAVGILADEKAAGRHAGLIPPHTTQARRDPPHLTQHRMLIFGMLVYRLKAMVGRVSPRQD